MLLQREGRSDLFQIKGAGALLELCPATPPEGFDGQLQFFEVVRKCI